MELGNTQVTRQPKKQVVATNVVNLVTLHETAMYACLLEGLLNLVMLKSTTSIVSSSRCHRW